MLEFNGSLGGLPWRGWVVERSEDLPAFRQWVQRHRNATVAFDTETYPADGIYQHGPEFLRLAQFGTETEAWAIPAELGEEYRAAIVEALRFLPKLCGHDVIRYDGQVIDRHLGFTLEEFCPKVTDTILTGKLIDPRRDSVGGIGHSLKVQSAHYIDPEAPDGQTELTKLFKSLKVGHTKDNPAGWVHVPLFNPVYLRYALLDPILNARLLAAHKRELDRLSIRRALVPYEHNISRLCALMSRAGIRVDRPYTESLYSTLDEEREKYAAVAARYGVTNPNSNAQIIAALEGAGEEWGRGDYTETGGKSVASGVLLRMADLNKDWELLESRTPNPLAEAILRTQRASKWRVAYVDKFLGSADADGRIHVNINTMEARTGRMSITGALAAQTLPKGDWMIRRCALAEEGHVMVSTDFASVEMRILAGLADVKRMKSAIAAGEDLNDFTASLVYGPGFTKPQRQICKGIGYGTIFGGGLAAILALTGAPAPQVEAARKIYGQIYPEIKKASNRWQREALGQGCVTYSATGRRLPLDRDRLYSVVNYRVQSTGRDVLGQAMLQCEAAGLLPYMKLPIHDEILASAPKGDAKDVAREFKRCMTMNVLGVPIDADPEIGGRSWGSLYGADF